MIFQLFTGKRLLQTLKFKCLALLVSFSLCSAASAQTYTAAALAENFAYEVKQIDEFFERFNDENTLIKSYAAQNAPGARIDRDILIKSLFNLHSTTIRKDDVYQFIAAVSNPGQPVLLNFYDNDWFARVKCAVQYEQKERELLLVLKVEKEPDGASKWVIHGVDADFFETPQVVDQAAFLNPISHGTDFLGLSKAFGDAQNVRSYLPANYREDQLSKLVLELQNKRIKFLQVKDVSYHFLQIEGWILTVENFQRPEKNSGWLISNLIRADLGAKEDYKQQVLKLSL